MKKANKKAESGNSKPSQPVNEDNKTLHTTNPFTGEKTDITSEDLKNMEKWNEAQTERD